MSVLETEGRDLGIPHPDQIVVLSSKRRTTASGLHARLASNFRVEDVGSRWALEACSGGSIPPALTRIGVDCPSSFVTLEQHRKGAGRCEPNGGPMVQMSKIGQGSGMACHAGMHTRLSARHHYFYKLLSLRCRQGRPQSFLEDTTAEGNLISSE